MTIWNKANWWSRVVWNSSANSALFNVCIMTTTCISVWRVVFLLQRTRRRASWSLALVFWCVHFTCTFLSRNRRCKLINIDPIAISYLMSVWCVWAFSVYSICIHMCMNTDTQRTLESVSSHSCLRCWPRAARVEFYHELRAGLRWEMNM